MGADHDGHRLRVRAFVEHCGDIPLASVTRAMASDFLTKVASGTSNRTANNYCTTLARLFKSATNRGRFTGNNPFADQKRKAGGKSYEPFSNKDLTSFSRRSPATSRQPSTHPNPLCLGSFELLLTLACGWRRLRD